MKKVRISPSILAVNYANTLDEIHEVARFVDSLHVDVMDGRFVRNYTLDKFSPEFVASLRKKLDLGLVVHLMFEEPEKYFSEYAGAGASEIIFHVEAAKNIASAARKLRSLGVRTGVSLKPATKAGVLKKFLRGIGACNDCRAWLWGARFYSLNA